MLVTDEIVQEIIRECESKVREITSNNAVVLVCYVRSIDFKLDYDKMSEMVCLVTGVPYKVAIKNRRFRQHVLTRHLIAYYGKQICKLNSVRLAERLNKDHTTILSSFKKVNNWLTTGDQLVCDTVAQINLIIEKLNQDDRPATTRTTDGSN
jgi:chromosomal replication initiation ATPase DnaA